MCLVCIMLCKEEGSSPVSPITERRDMGLYEVPLCMYLLGFGVGTMLANFHMCGIIWGSLLLVHPKKTVCFSQGNLVL